MHVAIAVDIQGLLDAEGELIGVLCNGKAVYFSDLFGEAEAPAPQPPAPPPPTPAPPAPNPPPPPPPPPASTQWVMGQTTFTEPATPKPAKGVVVPDVNFGCPVIRMTDHGPEAPVGFARNDYSRRQAFSANKTHQLIYALNGDWHIYNADTFAFVKTLTGPGADSEPHWHATNPDKLYYIYGSGYQMRLFELTVSTNTSVMIGNFASRLQARWPTATYSQTRSEGSPSADGRYWCFMVDNASWGSVGVFTWDRDTDTILGFLDTNGDRPDHVSMSPSGQFAVVSYVSAKGTVAYSRDFTMQRKLLDRSEHSDLAIDANGNDVYVSVDYTAGDVFFTNISTGARTTLFPAYIDGTARAFHFSGKAFEKPGYVLVSAYSDYGGTQKWMDRKIFVCELKANPAFYNVAWHHSVVPASGGYFFEPHATISRDGTRVAFTSGWRGQTNADIEAYQAQLFQLP